MNKLKDNAICIILPGWVTKHTGGAEWQAYHIANGFVDLNWNVEVLTVKDKIINKQYINNRVKYRYYRQKIFKSRTLAFLNIFFILCHTRAEVYYLRTDAKVERAALYIFCKLFEKKIFMAIASDDEVKQSNFSSKIIKSKVKLFVIKLDTFIINYFQKKGFFYANYICQNNYQSNFLKKSYNINSTIIPNSYFFGFIDDALIKKKSNIVLWVGNMRSVKRPELFLEIVEKSNEKWNFLMIGDKANYREMINDSEKFNSNFKYLGKLDYHDTYEYFKNAKILINTSTSEGFSNTFLEAWANGTWVITLGVDPDDLITSCNVGSVCKNTDEVVDKLKQIEVDGIPIDNLTKGIELVQERFNFQKNFSDLISLIQGNPVY